MVATQILKLKDSIEIQDIDTSKTVTTEAQLLESLHCRTWHYLRMLFFFDKGGTGRKHLLTF